ncbi:T-box protein VegT-like [Pecten maximus]|uniref:T-box protein VegT-like n=1 Tax=Pecten maximus TaxID=6579 RepID=UPI001458056F|nr:T-box protein VegT-like [Pecten maximus]
MEQPLDLCLRTSKVKSNTSCYQEDVKSAKHSLGVTKVTGYEIEDNEKMVQRWLQHMPTDRMVLSEYSPYIQAKSTVRGATLVPSGVSTGTDISVSLYNKALWRNFSQEGTEMIINRSGRLMYPRVEITIEGLNTYDMYSVEMVVIPVDDRRYKYKDNIWSAVGKSEVHHPITPYKHPTSPAVGSYWAKDHLSFGQAKLSNHLGPNKICLQSMHKYMVQINVIHHSRDDHLHSFMLPGTEFIALTAYLNEKITHLKISHNPFARAFKNKKTSDEDSDCEQEKKKILSTV